MGFVGCRSFKFVLQLQVERDTVDFSAAPRRQQGYQLDRLEQDKNGRRSSGQATFKAGFHCDWEILDVGRRALNVR